MEAPKMAQSAPSSTAFPAKNAASSTLHSYGRSASHCRFPLKNTTQTSGVGDHVRQISSNEDWSAMAVSLSSFAIKFYSPATNQFLGECKGHTEDIKHTSFSTPHLLHSCSLDGTIRAWDTRTMQQVAVINSGHGVRSISVDRECNLLAAGGYSGVPLWDLRNMKEVACLDCEGQATQVLFIPGMRNRLAYASHDDISISDTSRAVNDRYHHKYVCSTYIWDWRKEELESVFEAADLFPLNGFLGNYVDYIIDCHSSGVDNRLWVVAGTEAGTVGHFPVTSTKLRLSKEFAQAILEGGHNGKVTRVLPMSSRAGNSHTPQSVYGFGQAGRMGSYAVGFQMRRLN